MRRHLKSKAAMQAAARRYVATGDHDANDFGWPGNNVVEAEQGKHDILTGALMAEVRARSAGIRAPAVPGGLDVVGFTRERVRPMVEGLFSAREHEPVLALLERSVIFVTSHNVEQLVRDAGFLGTARSIADLYLGGIGAQRLGPKGTGILGLSEATKCYVSLEYFGEKDRFADFVVHEAAHIFHNWKREHAGLPHTRNKEWLLQIEYRKREVFAYSCEFFSRIVALASSPAERVNLAEECVGALRLGRRIDQALVVDSLREAAAARNGWKQILKRCATA